MQVVTKLSSNGRVRLARFARVRLLRQALPISFLILRKKTTVLQSKMENIAESDYNRSIFGDLFEFLSLKCLEVAS